MGLKVKKVVWGLQANLELGDRLDLQVFLVELEKKDLEVFQSKESQEETVSYIKGELMAEGVGVSSLVPNAVRSNQAGGLTFLSWRPHRI